LPVPIIPREAMSSATWSSGTAFAIGTQFAVETHCVRPNEIVR
jgi:hypothetical protein